MKPFSTSFRYTIVHAKRSVFVLLGSCAGVRNSIGMTRKQKLSKPLFTFVSEDKTTGVSLSFLFFGGIKIIIDYFNYHTRRRI